MKNGLRASNWMVILYNDDENYNFYLDNITSNYDYVYIVHDKDINDDGSIKKCHTHVIFNTFGQCALSSVAKVIGICENYIEPVRVLRSSLQYLIHFNNPEKYQYSVESVVGSDKLLDRFNQSVCNIISESEKVIILINYINDSYSLISYNEFSLYCSSIGYWDVFRRSAVIFIKLIEEHNRFINSKKNY